MQAVLHLLAEMCLLKPHTKRSSGKLDDELQAAASVLHSQDFIISL